MKPKKIAITCGLACAAMGMLNTAAQAQVSGRCHSHRP